MENSIFQFQWQPDDEKRHLTCLPDDPFSLALRFGNLI